jgi:hypothetical protein
MIIKLVAFGFKDYINHDAFNVFESIIVVITLIDMIAVNIILN